MLVLVIVSVGLVSASPWALLALGQDNLDWSRLSNIGQTYGAVSAVVASVALFGVVASLVIQSREVKAARLNSQRDHHVNLMRMAMDDPLYMECFGPYLTENFETERQLVYINLLVAQWYSEYEIGEPSDAPLRAAAVNVFASNPGRRYWEVAGQYWQDNYPGRRAKRFQRVLDEAYREALKRPATTTPVVAPAPVSGSRGLSRSSWWLTLSSAAVCGMMATISGGVVAYCFLKRREKGKGSG
ncbi:MAG TPA: DUF6082 family protein [Pseudonocardiaceae bacterium]|nr:DUF6082 family protein [Pseudonocardiaceae bacterium]